MLRRIIFILFDRRNGKIERCLVLLRAILPEAALTLTSYRVKISSLLFCFVFRETEVKDKRNLVIW